MDGHGSHTAIDFLWYCKQNKIHLLFLPGHISHVLQPLNLGVFAPLKSRYRAQIAALASLDDASPVKKQRFVTCYNIARKETFTPRLLHLLHHHNVKKHLQFLAHLRALNIYIGLLNQFAKNKVKNRHYIKLYIRLVMQLTVLMPLRLPYNTVDTLTIKKRKKVPIDPNLKFATVD
ncbi:hypothetical protein E4T50_04115 [Aureobasidium sp. EXF-12298]|nr:hypothetical protein E4T50_04115 [Aureobasidium sp. EXF-12298]